MLEEREWNLTEPTPEQVQLASARRLASQKGEALTQKQRIAALPNANLVTRIKEQREAAGN
jgi:hypothetical protein